MAEFYVYVYRDASGQPLYVGKGTGKRDVRHRIEMNAGSKTYWHNKLRKMEREGHAYSIERVAEGLTHEEACETERTLIAEHGRRNIDPGGILYNMLSGGDGASPEDMRRMYEDPEFRARQAEGAKKRALDPQWRANVIAANKRAMQRAGAMEDLEKAREIRWSAEGAGDHHSEKMQEWYADPENKERQAEALREKRRSDPVFDRRQREGTKRKWQDPEFRAKKAESNRQSWKKPGRREKHSEVMTEMFKDPVIRERHAEAMRRVMASPEWREKIAKAAKDPERLRKISEATKKRASDPSYQKRMSVAARKRWQDPEYREKMMLARQQGNAKRASDPEYRAKQAAIMKAKWQDPVFREMMKRRQNKRGAA